MCEFYYFPIESWVCDWFATGLRLGKPRGDAQVSKFGFPYHAKAMKRDRERR